MNLFGLDYIYKKKWEKKKFTTSLFPFLFPLSRSAYFQQIEEDVQKHAKTIMELKPAITSFQTKDMNEMLKFHKHVESCLEALTDESQVEKYEFAQILFCYSPLLSAYIFHLKIT